MAHTLLEPPPAESRPPDPEALIEEARRRARRRRAAYAAAAVLAVAAGLVALFGAGGGGTKARRARERGRPTATAPRVGKLVGTLPIRSNLFAARGGTLFALQLQPTRPSSVVVVRAGAKVTKRRISFPHAEFLMTPTVGRYGLYPGFNVIKRFTSAPDVLVRIDLRTLGVRARALFPATVQPAAAGNGLWASVADGRVVRLDAKTLALQASRRVGSDALSRPVVGLGSVWVLTGDRPRMELLRLDPVTLRIRSRARVPGGLDGLVADARHVYLSGERKLVPVSSSGAIGRPVLFPSSAALAVQGGRMVALLNRPDLALLTPAGKILARTPLRDWSANLASSGSDVWFLGDAGRGEGIVHVHLG